MSNFIENIMIAIVSGSLGMMIMCMLIMASKDKYNG